MRESEQLNEWVWLLPAIASAVRLGAPALGKFLLNQSPKVVKKGADIGLGGGKILLKNPGTVATAAGGYYLYKTVDEAIESITKMVGDALDALTIENLAKVVMKYSLPIAAVVAILYGGKKLIDYMNQNEDPAAAQNG